MAICRSCIKTIDATSLHSMKQKGVLAPSPCRSQALRIAAELWPAYSDADCVCHLLDLLLTGLSFHARHHSLQRNARADIACNNYLVYLMYHIKVMMKGRKMSGPVITAFSFRATYMSHDNSSGHIVSIDISKGRSNQPHRRSLREPARRDPHHPIFNTYVPRVM